VIIKDPFFAPAYAGLAAAYAASSAQGFRHDHAEELARMRLAAEKAIQLDPLLAEAHDAQGMVYAREGKFAEAETSFKRAIDLDPSDSVAYHDMTIYVLLPLGRIDEALRVMRIAKATDPLSPFVQTVLAKVYLFAHRFDEAARHCEELPADFPPKIDCVAQARLGQGRIDEAIRILANDKMQRDLGYAYLGYAYACAGRRDEAERLAAAVVPNAFSQAIIFAGLGDKDRTLEALDRVTQLGAVRIGRALNSPEFDLLRGDPRVKTLRRKAGLPEDER
jgi:tetratricopeptide (TPR) repeat protein